MTVIAGPVRHFAEGGYASEAEGVDELCSFAERSGAFRVFREVEGVLEATKPGKQRKDVRIDVLLFPTNALLDKGWNEGVIGVECKRPGKKLGVTFAQVMDYAETRFIWKREAGGLYADVTPRYFFLFPYDLGQQCCPSCGTRQAEGDMESAMASQRIGTLQIKMQPNTARWLHFKVGGCVPLKVYENGDITVTTQGLPGRKVGSR